MLECVGVLVAEVTLLHPGVDPNSGMYVVPLKQLEHILTEVNAALPREASGLLLRSEHKRLTVLSVVATSSEENTLLSFRIRDEAIATIAASLRDSKTKICGCFHSHVLGEARPSRRDRAATKEAGDLWLIYSVRFRKLNLFHWDGMTFRKERFRITTENLPAL